MCFRLQIILAILILFLFNKTYSQQRDSIQNSTLGIHFFQNDHFSGNPFKTYSKAPVSKMFPGFAISFTKGISKHFDWNAIVYTTFVDSIIKNKQPSGKKDLFADANFSIRAKMFSNLKRFQPFVQVGIGVSQYKSNTGVFIPAGAGVQVNIFSDVYLTLQTKYSLPVGSSFREYFSHSLGVSGVIGKSKRKQGQKIVVVSTVTNYINNDRDRDGILDSADICPEIPGLVQFHGCPDRDEDGIEDKLDHCPDLPGVVAYQGCPEPDTDKDGILDKMDKCIEVPGVVEYQGCPVPDRDNDGVRDQEDNCPDISGTSRNLGCPEIKADIQMKLETAARNIFFHSGSYVLLPKSHDALDEVVSILKSDRNLRLDIEGHTDNVGDSTKNQHLSEQRAQAVKNYLFNKGVKEERLTAVGFGEQKPIADNDSSSGRSNNRRVRLELYY